MNVNTIKKILILDSLLLVTPLWFIVLDYMANNSISTSVIHIVVIWEIIDAIIAIVFDVLIIKADSKK